MKSKREITKIMIVDDHPVVRQGIKMIIDSEDDLTVCGEAERANEAIKLVGDLEPDMVIVDIELKGEVNGIELVKTIKKRFPGIASIVLSMSGGSFFVERALKAGAKGYVTKDEAPDKIITAIRSVMSGELYLDEKVSVKLVDRLVHKSDDSRDSMDTLSDREFEVFQLIGKGYRRRDIAKRLNLNINTIESHRRNIREKLKIDNSAELSRIAIHWLLDKKV